MKKKNLSSVVSKTVKTTCNIKMSLKISPA